MAAVWPGTLPQAFRIGSLQIAMAENTIRSQPDKGPAMVRKRTTANTRPIAGEMIMTRAQWATLETFYDQNDSLQIEFPDPLGSGNLTVRFASPPAMTGRAAVDVLSVALSFEELP